MDYLPGKKDLLQNNNFNHNPNPFISPKNDFFYKESPIQQPSYKNDFNDKRKHAVSPSPRYRESNILEKNNNIDKFLKREPQKPNYKPDIFNKPKENNSFLPPSASNKNKDAIILKTPYKDQKRDEKEKKQNNNSYQELINKNEVCITEPGKMAKKTSEQKFENLKKKYNIKDKEEENKKQEPQRDKIREFERKQMMNDIEQKVN